MMYILACITNDPSVETYVFSTFEAAENYLKDYLAFNGFELDLKEKIANWVEYTTHEVDRSELYFTITPTNLDPVFK